MTTDAQPRGAHLLDAAITILAEEGFGGLSMRTVAAKAGVSPAQVQYYFRTKEELIGAGFNHVSTQFVQALASLEPREPSLTGLREAIALWLPLDAEREKRARVWIVYAAAAVTDESLRAESAQLDAGI